MNGKNIIVENIKINQPMKYVLKTDVSALLAQCLNSANPKRKETGDIEAGNYQNKPFLKESFYTLKNNIGIGERMRIYNGFRFEAQCPNCGNWTDDVDDKQDYACCFHCGLMKLDNIFEVREGRYIKVI